MCISDVVTTTTTTGNHVDNTYNGNNANPNPHPNPSPSTSPGFITKERYMAHVVQCSKLENDSDKESDQQSLSQSQSTYQSGNNNNSNGNGDEMCRKKARINDMSSMNNNYTNTDSNTNSDTNNSWLYARNPDQFIKNTPKYGIYYRTMEQSRADRLQKRAESCYNLSNWRCFRPVLACFLPNFLLFIINLFFLPIVFLLSYK